MNPTTYPRPVLLLVSAPSGAGKTTLCQQLLAAESANLRYSVSCTTRPPRKGETDGEDYFFLSRTQFEQEIAAGAFLEYAEVYGNYYGTRISFLHETLNQGGSVLMDVDVQGADIIRKALLASDGDPVLRRALVDVFIHPPSLQALRQRLESRGKDDPQVIERRMRNAEIEMVAADQYQYQFVNGDLTTAFETFRAIYTASRHRTASV
ncbi:MAG: guanylate kinase [Verrucomicrobia bacterium]|nr:guanylate kinase [Verrucomicrobiota bacterium]MCH8512107.1 guanylate kinase [Kiritimatiellia bacterium]